MSELKTYKFSESDENPIAFTNREHDKFKQQKLEEKIQEELDFQESINMLGLVEDNIKKVKTSTNKKEEL